MQNFYLDHINKIRRYLDPQTAKCVVNALVLSRLDYCNSLFVGLPVTYLNAFSTSRTPLPARS